MILCNNRYEGIIVSEGKIMIQKTIIKDTYKYLLENDAKFKAFVKENKDKTTEEIARKYNLNWLIKG